MTRDWEDRYRSGGGYGRRDDYGRRDRSRDWSDKAGDEVRSWFGDDDADRRRRMDDDRDYGSSGGGYGGRSGRGGYGDDYGRSGDYGSRSGDYGGRSSGGYGNDIGRSRDYGGRSGAEYGGRSASGYGRSSGGYDPYDQDRGYGETRDTGYGRGDFSESIRSGMAGRGMGTFGTYGARDYGDRDHGRRVYDHGNYRGSDDRGFFERAGDEVASWFGDEDAQRRRERDAGHSGRGPRNYSRSDDRIREDVSDRLSDDRHIDASDIEVSVSGGEVTLDGTVDSRSAKRHAEDLAESCSGVKHVQNNLRVKDRQMSGGYSGSMTGSGSTGMSGGSGSGMGSNSGTTGTTGSGSTTISGSGSSKTQV